jgi:hypothetical protein
MGLNGEGGSEEPSGGGGGSGGRRRSSGSAAAAAAARFSQIKRQLRVLLRCDYDGPGAERAHQNAVLVATVAGAYTVGEAVNF